MATDITYGQDARLRILRGVEKLSSVVGVTLGPSGRNVIIGPSASPRISRDGQTVANEVELADLHENAGVRMVREVASRTAKEAGDGTTTATVLAHAIYREGVRNVEAGADPMEVKRGIELAVRAAVAGLDRIASMADPLPDEERRQIATDVAARSPKTIGEIADELTIPLRAESLRAHVISPLQPLPSHFWSRGARDAVSLDDLDRIVAKAEEHATVCANASRADIAAALRRRRLECVARIAGVAANDEALGAAVAEAMERVGAHGAVVVEEGRSVETAVEIVDGVRFDRGYLSPYFVTDPERMLVELDTPAVLLADFDIRSLQELLPLLEKVAGARGQLLIVSGDVSGDVLPALVTNHLRGTLRVAAVKAPAFGDEREVILDDLAVFTGGRVFSKSRGDDLSRVELAHLGRASRAVIDARTTTIVADAEDALRRGKLRTRIRQLEARAALARSDSEQRALEEQMARLAGGVAIIRLGAMTATEMTEKRARLDDALHASRAALEEGILPGGGAALLHVRFDLDALGVTGDCATGVNVVRHALAAPFRRIMENAGLEPSLMVAQVERRHPLWGVDTRSACPVDMLDAGIIDAAKVTKRALLHAASIAGLLLTTEVAVTSDARPAAPAP